jgi:hypothetical protein
MQQNEPDSGKSWLQEKLTRLEAIYQRFGRDGLREHPLPEVNLLLQQKMLEFRDLPKGRDLEDQQKAESRRLELEINDLTGFVNSQLALVSSPGLRVLRGFGGQTQQQQPSQQRGYQKRHFEPER